MDHQKLNNYSFWSRTIGRRFGVHEIWEYCADSNIMITFLNGKFVGEMCNWIGHWVDAVPSHF